MVHARGRTFLMYLLSSQSRFDHVCDVFKKWHRCIRVSFQGNQSQISPESSDANPRSSGLVTPRSSKSSSRAPPQMIILNDKYTPVPIEKFNYDDTIATGLDEFEPYKPLVDSKYFTSVKVWVLLHRGEEMLVELKDCTRHLRLIHQVMIIFNTLTTTANCRLLL